MSISCSAADVVSSVNWFIVFKLLMLNVVMLTMFVHQSNFGLGLSSVSDFSKTVVARAPTLEERALTLLARRTMHFGHTFWIRVMVNFCWLLPPRWTALIFWLNYLILTVDLGGSFIQDLLKRTVDPTLDSSTFTPHPSCYFPWLPLIYASIFLFRGERVFWIFFFFVFPCFARLNSKLYYNYCF